MATPIRDICHPVLAMSGGDISLSSCLNWPTSSNHCMINLRLIYILWTDRHAHTSSGMWLQALVRSTNKTGWPSLSEETNGAFPSCSAILLSSRASCSGICCTSFLRERDGQDHSLLMVRTSTRHNHT